MRIFAAICILSLTLLPSAAFADSAKIGFVNVPYLIDNSPQAKSASNELEEDFGPKQKQLQEKQQAFQDLQKKLQKDGLVMSDEERQDAQSRLRKMKRDIQRMQSAFREDLNIKRNSAFKDVRKAVMKAVQNLAKEEGYDIVVGQGALYASDSVNLTKRVLERMKEEYDGGGS